MTRMCSCTGNLASTVELSGTRNNLTKASCRTCGGRPLVDGMGPASPSMLTTVGLELKNFINPDLSWNTVTKGYRSTTRRSRKAGAKRWNVGAELGDQNPKSLGDSSVSESEKLGVAVLGRRFADKLEDVPIKKRRLLLRSPSPPPRTPSPHREESLSPQPQTSSPETGEPEQLLDHKCASGQWSSCADSFSNRHGSIAVKFGEGGDDGLMDGKISEVIVGKLGYTEDFSGIALLAAAACYDSIGVDADNAKDSVVEEFSTREGFVSPTSTVPMKETIASLETGNLFQKGLTHEDNMDGSFVQDRSIAVLPNLHNDNDDGTVKKSVPSKDDRLRWDLNTVMDAWEQPFDDPSVHFHGHVSKGVLDDGMHAEGRENLEGCDAQRNSEDLQHDLESEVQSVLCRMVSADVHGDRMLLDSKGMALGPPKLSIEEHKLETCADLEKACTEEKCVPFQNEQALEPLNHAGADTKASSQVVSMDASPVYSPCSGSHHVSSTWVSVEKINTASASISVQQNREDCCRTSAMRPDVPISGKIMYEINSSQSKDGDDFGKASGIADNRTFLREMISPAICRSFDAENSSGGLGKVGLSHSSSKGEDLSASVTSVGEGEPVVIGDAKGQDDRASGTVAKGIDSPVRVMPKELLPKYHGHSVPKEETQGGFISQESYKSHSDDPAYRSGKIALTFDDCDSMDISLDDQGHIDGVENKAELQAGYDSPFEDGELRESVVYSWEENEIEGGETECVDYESDNREGGDFDAADYSMLEKVEVGSEGSQIVEKGCSSVTKVMEAEFSKSRSVKTLSMQLGRQSTREDDSESIEMVGKKGLNAGSSNSLEKCVKGDALKEPSHLSGLKTKTSGWGHFQEHDELCADMGVEVNSGSARKTRTSDRLDLLDVNGSLVGDDGSRASRGKLLSRVEGPSSLDDLDRKEIVLIQQSRSRNFGDSYSRAERDFGPGKSMGRDRSYLRVRGRIEGDGYWVDSSVGYWDSRNRYPSSYRGLEGHSQTRPRSDIANSAAKIGGVNCYDRRQSINYSSKGMYRLPIRGRSPIDRDDCYGAHRGLPPVRGIGRSRSRSGIYPRGVGRGPREEYHEPVLDDSTASSVRMPHYLARRKRSLSPAFGRGSHFSRPCRKSRSRSRTRSPPAWHLQQRERNMGARRHSRSPDLRSEARMERMRLPFQKPSFSNDYEESFMSPPRGRFSPQHNSRWIDDRNCVDDHLRDRRSPVRIFRRSQRFDSVGYSGRLKSDDYFRPMRRHVRFPQMAGAGRGRKYEESDDDRRKHDDRYEMIHRVRRYDTGGVVRRFRYDTEECIETRNLHNEDDCIRGTDRRDVSRSCREERSPFRYNNDRMYATTAPSSGLQEYDKDASPIRG